MLEEVRAAAAGVRERIGKHVEQAGHCRTMIRRLTEQIGEECRTAAELREEIGVLLRKADEETGRVRADLESRYGIAVPFAEVLPEGDIGPQLARDLDDLGRFREGLLALDEGALPPAEGPAPAEPVETAEEAEYASVPAPEPVAQPEPVARPEVVAEAAGPEAEEVSRRLESLLETESVPEAGSFRVYRKAGRAVLDPNSILDEMARSLEDARSLHVRLAETKSAKEQYFVKRDILARQEALRRTVARVAEACAGGDCNVPAPAGDILGEASLKDLQERLSLGNWSDVHDLGSFEERLESLRTGLAALMANRPAYERAIIEQLDRAV